MAIKNRKHPAPRQKVWDYMRRNRASFKVSDILILTDNTIDQLRRYMQALESAGYIKLIEKKNFKESMYKLIKITGPIAPTIRSDKVIDKNTGEEIDIRRYPIFLKVQKRIVSLYHDNNEIRVNNMADCGGRTTVKKELTRLTELGVIAIIRKEWRGYVYRADIARLEQMIQEEEQKRCLHT